MVYIILGKGFEPMEAVAPCDILRRGGADVRFAGIGGTLIEGGHGIAFGLGHRKHGGIYPEVPLVGIATDGYLKPELHRNAVGRHAGVCR